MILRETLEFAAARYSEKFAMVDWQRGDRSFIRCWKHCSTCGVLGSNIEQNRV